MVCPASMLANKRIDRLMGRAANEMISSGTRNILMANGALGTNSLKKPKPWRQKPVTMTVRITSAVSAKVMAIWLVTVKATGISPKPLQNSTNMKIEKMSGKYRIRSEEHTSELQSN